MERVEESTCSSYMDPEWKGNLGRVCQLRLINPTFPVIDTESVNVNIQFPYKAKGLFLIVDGVKYTLNNVPTHPSALETSSTYPNCQLNVKFKEEYGYLEIFGPHKVVNVTKNHCMQRDTASDLIEVGYYLPKTFFGLADVGLLLQFVVPFSLFTVIALVFKFLI